MSKISQDAITFAHRTGIDRLSEHDRCATDANQNGEIDLTEATSLAAEAELDGDARLQHVERARAQALLGCDPGAPTIQAPVPGAIRSILNARCAVPPRRRLPTGLVEVSKRDTPRGLEVELRFTRHDQDDNPVALQHGTVCVPGLHLTQPIAQQHYDRRGRLDLPGDPDARFGAGVLLAGTDPHLGVVLLDVAARDAVRGRDPDLRSVGTIDDLLDSAAVLELALSAGLDPAQVELEVDESLLTSSGLPEINFLNLAVSLRDQQGEQARGWVHAELKGNLAQGLDYVDIGELRPGKGERVADTPAPSADPGHHVTASRDAHGLASNPVRRMVADAGLSARGFDDPERA